MKLLVGHDGSKQADKALQRAIAMAAATKGSITVLTVVPDLCMMEISDDDCKKMYEIMTTESEKRLSALKDDVAKKGVSLETVVKFGNATDAIITTAGERQVEMIVVGSHGRHGSKKFLLGSVSSKVVDHASCDVLVVK